MTTRLDIPAPVVFPCCGRSLLANAAAYLIGDRGLVVPPGRSVRCPGCHKAHTPGSLLPYYRPGPHMVNGRIATVRWKEVTLIRA